MKTIKLIIIAILSMCLLMIIPNQKISLLGDVNGDGAIDKIDIELVHQHITKGIELGENEKVRADVNKDGEINLIDIFDIHTIIRGEQYGKYR